MYDPGTWRRVGGGALVLALLAVPARGAGPTLTVETAVQLRRVVDAVISPGGDRAAYVLSVPRGAGDPRGRPWTEIRVVSLDGGEDRPYSPPGARASAPRFSPDGGRLAYLFQRGDEARDTAQIVVIPVDGGEARPLPAHETGVAGLRWSPDGGRIAFSAPDRDAGDEADEQDPDDRIVLDEDPTYTRLWTIEIESGAAQPVYEGPLDASAFEWTPDGAALVFIAAASPDTDEGMMHSRLYRAAVPGPGATPAAARPLVIAPTAGKLGDLALSPSGETLAFLGATSANDPLPQSLFLEPMDGSEPTRLGVEGESSAVEIRWLDEATLLELTHQGTGTVLARIDVRRRTRRLLPLRGAPIIDRVSVDARSGRFCAIAHAPRHPPELYGGQLEAPDLQRLTDHNPHLAELTLAREETIAWTSTDGLRIEGVLTSPPGPGIHPPFPLVVNPHGGPEGVTMEGWNELPQLLAARGYLVLQPNYRGSGGRGVAFSQGDHDDLGGLEFQDILTGIDALVRRGLADPGRVGMGGWSYGGYLSAMAATHHSGRFKAAVMGAGISNWVSFTGTTDIPLEMSTVHWNRSMEDNVDLYWQRSPLAALEHAHTPTLILSGAADERVPPSQGRELYRALRTRGVPVQMVLYPRGEHGIRERAHRIDLLTRQLDFFDRYLKPVRAAHP